MAKLVLSSGGSVLYQCFLDKDRVGIGREPHNQVVVDDAAVNGEHAAIFQVGNDHVLEDLHSTNGTFVNGGRVLRHILQHGDVIEFGALYLRYLNPRATLEIDLERTMLVAGLYASGDDARHERGSLAAEVRVPSARAARIRFPRGRVSAIAGSRAGKTIELDRVVALFGKSGDQLAVVTRRPHGYFITHVEGLRFPRVNHQSIGRGSRMLNSGDVFEVADEKLEFFLD